MKNIKLNNLIRKFMTVAYILAIVGGIAIGLMPSNVLWAILFMPLAILVLLLLAYFANIWVEHRYVTYPFERNAQVTLDANKVLNKELEELKAENDECHSQILRNQTEHREALQRRQDVNTDLWFENDSLKKELEKMKQLLEQREEKLKIYAKNRRVNLTTFEGLKNLANTVQNINTGVHRYQKNTKKGQ